MTTLHWQRPRAKPAQCVACTVPTSMEYADTPQCEPDEYTIWRPLCLSHRPFTFGQDTRYSSCYFVGDQG